MAEPDLAILLEARLAGFERQLKSAYTMTDQNLRRVENRSKQAASKIEKDFSGIGAGLLAGAASAVSLRAAQQLIDSSTRITNSLKVTGLAGEDLDKVYQSLFASAQRNAAPIEDLVTLYSRASQSASDLGASQAEMLQFTDNVALSLRVGGKSAEEASGALLQLSQVLGGGMVQAEEYNSLIDGAQPLLQAVAAGLDEAGGSVSALTRLVKDGKVSSKAFFDAFEAGSGTLQDKVAGAEVTVSSSFVRLQNVLIDAAGKFNETSSAGQRFAGFLDTLGTSITNLANSPGLDNFLNSLGDSFNTTVQRNHDATAEVMAMADGLAQAFDHYGASVSDAEIKLDSAYQSMANLATNTKGRFGEVGGAFQDLVQELIEGRGTAETAAVAITALGKANPDFSTLQDKISETIQSFIALRDAANAAHAAAAQTDAVGGGASWQEFSSAFVPPTPVKPVTLADYPIAPTARGGGGGGRSAGSARAEADATKDLIAELENELRVIGMSEVEQRVNAELRKAGASATDDQKASIRDLVTQIDTQSAAMDRLEQASANAKGIAKDFLGGLIGDLRSGVDGATALANAFGGLADKLLDMALDSLINSLFSNLMGSAGGGGLLGGLFGFSDGGAVKAATGGLIRGPGTSTSDSIPARLSDGEFVVNAGATRRNMALLQALNDGSVASFATGGLVGDSPSLRAANDNIGHANDNTAPVFQISAPITVNASGGTPEQNNDLATKMAKQLEGTMRGVVASELKRQTKQGNTLNTRSR